MSLRGLRSVLAFVSACAGFWRDFVGLPVVFPAFGALPPRAALAAFVAVSPGEVAVVSALASSAAGFVFLVLMGGKLSCSRRADIRLSYGRRTRAWRSGWG